MIDYEAERVGFTAWLKNEAEHYATVPSGSFIEGRYRALIALLDHYGRTIVTAPSPEKITRGGGNATMTREEAAKYVGVSVAFMNRSRVVGAGPAYVKIGRRVLYRSSDLDAWLAQHRRLSTSAPGLVFKQFGRV